MGPTDLTEHAAPGWGALVDRENGTNREIARWREVVHAICRCAVIVDYREIARWREVVQRAGVKPEQ